jgi:hypothetical protein
MAKLKAPLLSLGASGALGKTLVFFPWKGLAVAREYVVPSNPKTTAQTTQRGYVTAAVDDIHAAQIAASEPLVEVDKSAYALLASLEPSPRTWFNQAVKNAVDVAVAGDTPTVFRGGASTPGDGTLAIEIYSDEIDLTNITAAHVFYGTSKTALLNSLACTITGGSNKADKTIPSLTNGQKYYWQVRVDAGENCEGAVSGIYYGTPAA